MSDVDELSDSLKGKEAEFYQELAQKKAPEQVSRGKIIIAGGFVLIGGFFVSIYSSCDNNGGAPIVTHVIQDIDEVTSKPDHLYLRDIVNPADPDDPGYQPATVSPASTFKIKFSKPAQISTLIHSTMGIHLEYKQPNGSYAKEYLDSGDIQVDPTDPKIVYVNPDPDLPENIETKLVLGSKVKLEIPSGTASTTKEIDINNGEYTYSGDLSVVVEDLDPNSSTYGATGYLGDFQFNNITNGSYREIHRITGHPINSSDMDEIQKLKDFSYWLLDLIDPNSPIYEPALAQEILGISNPADLDYVKDHLYIEGDPVRGVGPLVNPNSPYHKRVVLLDFENVEKD